MGNPDEHSDLAHKGTVATMGSWGIPPHTTLIFPGHLYGDKLIIKGSQIPKENTEACG
jgi:hypothetical protein